VGSDAAAYKKEVSKQVSKQATNQPSKYGLMWFKYIIELFYY
jgi:hypothetical protein